MFTGKAQASRIISRHTEIVNGKKVNEVDTLGEVYIGFDGTDCYDYATFIETSKSDGSMDYEFVKSWVKYTDHDYHYLKDGKLEYYDAVYAYEPNDDGSVKVIKDNRSIATKVAGPQTLTVYGNGYASEYPGKGSSKSAPSTKKSAPTKKAATPKKSTTPSSNTTKKITHTDAECELKVTIEPTESNRDPIVLHISNIVDGKPAKHIGLALVKSYDRDKPIKYGEYTPTVTITEPGVYYLYYTVELYDGYKYSGVAWDRLNVAATPSGNPSSSANTSSAVELSNKNSTQPAFIAGTARPVNEGFFKRVLDFILNLFKWHSKK